MHGPKCKVGSFCTVGKRLQEVNILGGLILPLWRIIEKALDKQVCTLPLSPKISKAARSHFKTFGHFLGVSAMINNVGGGFSLFFLSLISYYCFL